MLRNPRWLVPLLFACSTLACSSGATSVALPPGPSTTKGEAAAAKAPATEPAEKTAPSTERKPLIEPLGTVQFIGQNVGSITIPRTGIDRYEIWAHGPLLYRQGQVVGLALTADNQRNLQLLEQHRDRVTMVVCSGTCILDASLGPALARLPADPLYVYAHAEAGDVATPLDALAALTDKRVVLGSEDAGMLMSELAKVPRLVQYSNERHFLDGQFPPQPTLQILEVARLRFEAAEPLLPDPMPEPHPGIRYLKVGFLLARQMPLVMRLPALEHLVFGGEDDRRRPEWLAPLASLPKLRALDLRNMGHLVAPDLSVLASAKALRRLRIGLCYDNLSQRCGIAKLTGQYAVPQLEELALGTSPWSVSKEPIPTSWPPDGLRRLTLTASGEDLLALLERVAERPSVRQLRIAVEEYSDAHLAAIARIASLRELELVGNYTPSAQDAAGYQMLTGLRELEHLRIDNRKRAPLPDLSAFPRLRRFGGRYLRDSDIANIARARALRTLDLNGRFSPDAIRSLTQLPALDQLTLGGNIADRHATAIAELTQVRELRFFGAWKLTDTAMTALQTMTGLQVASFTDTGISPAGAQALRTALPACQVHKLSHKWPARK